MFFLDLLLVLPQLFTVGEDLVACLNGKATQEVWNKTVDDVFTLAKSIPEIQGVIVMNQGLFMFAKVLFPLLDQMTHLPPVKLNCV